eukprot:gene2929-5754_t
MPKIRVGIRSKPQESGMKIQGFFGEQNHSSAKLEMLMNDSRHEFIFDNYFDENCGQTDIFNTIMRPLIDDSLEGYNATVFAFGQTGAGKTHTVTGSASGEYEGRGLCLRTAEYLFDRIRRFQDTVVVSVQISVLEVYNETLLDLLRDPAHHEAVKLMVVDTPAGVLVPSLYLLPVSTAEEASTHLLDANLNRAVAEHKLNRRSSRSHCIYTFHITRTNSPLPSSESRNRDRDRDRATPDGGGGSSGSGNGVTSSLDVSMLHYLIACVWAHSNHMWETMSTLRFSARMKCIESVDPVRNRDGNNMSQAASARDAALIRSLRKEVQQLRKELALRDVVTAREIAGEVWYTELSTPQREYTLQLTGKFLCTDSCSGGSELCQDISDDVRDRQKQTQEDTELELEVYSFSQVQFMARSLRSMLWEACNHTPDRVYDIVKEATAFDYKLAMNKGMVGDKQDNDDNDTTTASTTTTLPVMGISSYDPHIDNAAMYDFNDGDGMSDGRTGIAVAKRLSIGTNMNMNQAGDFMTVAEDAAPVSAPLRVEDKFAEFKLGAGAALHEAYEEIKTNMRLSKMRQKELIQIVNQTKNHIDELQQQLLGGDSTSLSKANLQILRDHMTTDLEDAKKRYKAAYSELKECKEALSQMEKEKKIALAELLQAFEHTS